MGVLPRVGVSRTLWSLFANQPSGSFPKKRAVCMSALFVKQRGPTTQPSAPLAHGPALPRAAHLHSGDLLSTLLVQLDVEPAKVGETRGRGGSERPAASTKCGAARRKLAGAHINTIATRAGRAMCGQASSGLVGSLPACGQLA